jgi:exodeoxyribonuclease VII small subunit
MPKAKEKAPGFEESLSSLEKIVALLESGDLPLERALEIFEEGVGLARRCQSQLDDAERKVEVLLRERGEIRTVPFEPKADSVTSQIKSAPLSSISVTSKPVISHFEEVEPGDDITDDSIPF